MSAWTAVATGVVVGGAIGWLIVQDARATEAVHKFVAETRLPEPSFAMKLPRTAAEFATLDSLVCECLATYAPKDTGQPTAQPSDAGAVSEDERVEAVVDCVARRLYPQFPWPPMVGDHPSTAELWATLETLTHRALATASCGVPAPNPFRETRST